jgi:hypothetical protein
MHDPRSASVPGPPVDDAAVPTRTRGRIAAVAIALIAAGMIWPWILAERDAFSQKSYDHDRFHLPLVRSFAAQWPAVDLSDYDSATGPGYHLVLATAAQVLGDGETMLQMLGSLFAIGLLATVAWRLARWRGSELEGLLLTLPLAASPYLLGNAIWLMTDNLSLWLLAVPILGASLLSATPSRLGRWGVAAVAACFVRQINLWVLAPIAVATWFATWTTTRRSGVGDRSRNASWSISPEAVAEEGVPIPESPKGRPGPVLLAAAIACLLPIAIVAGLAWLWGGLTPPTFQQYHAVSVQPAAVPFGLALFATYGAPLWLAIAAGRGERGRVPRWFLLASSLGWAGFVLAGESFAGLDVGRNGGWLWTLVGKAPSPGGVSSVLAVGSAVGVALLMQLVALAFGRSGTCGRGAIVAAVALAACLVAHAANAQLFQRYFDAPVLLVLAVLATLAWPRGGEGPAVDPRRDRPWILALLAMVAMQIAFATATLFLPLAGG